MATKPKSKAKKKPSKKAAPKSKAKPVKKAAKKAKAKPAKKIKAKAKPIAKKVKAKAKPYAKKVKAKAKPYAKKVKAKAKPAPKSKKAKTKIIAKKIKSVKKVAVKPKTSAKPQPAPKPAAVEVNQKELTPANGNDKSNLKLRYSDEDLIEFKAIITEKLAEARRDLDLLRSSMSHLDDHGTDDTSPTFKLMEDGSDVLSKEETAQLAARQQKFIKHLEDAMVRIENKSYGICRATGNLIPKERLRVVPHATLSIEAKQKQF